MNLMHGSRSKEFANDLFFSNVCVYVVHVRELWLMLKSSIQMNEQHAQTRLFVYSNLVCCMQMNRWSTFNVLDKNSIKNQMRIFKFQLQKQYLINSIPIRTQFKVSKKKLIFNCHCNGEHPSMLLLQHTGNEDNQNSWKFWHFILLFYHKK